MRVLVADRLSPKVTEKLHSLGCSVDIRPDAKGSSLAEAISERDPHVLVVRSTRVEADHIDRGRSLILVIRAGAGFNTIDTARASARGVYVANCPGKNAIAVAELAMGHLLNLDRRITDNVTLLRQHRWAKKEFGKAQGLYGRTLAVLGTGQVGREVIHRALAFGLHVRAWDKALTPEDARELGVTWCATALDACRGADALTVHLALNDGTRGLVGDELLGALAQGAYVINTSRGEVVDQDALERAIQGRGLRAGLDVYAEEPGASDSEFPFGIADNQGVYGTHHIGASTEQASEAVGDEVVRIVRQFLATGHPPNCVNLEDKTDATHLLLVRHADQVGVLAHVLDAISEAGVNVQEMENTIFTGGTSACARIQIEGDPTHGLVARLDATEHVFATIVVPLNR